MRRFFVCILIFFLIINISLSSFCFDVDYSGKKYSFDDSIFNYGSQVIIFKHSHPRGLGSDICICVGDDLFLLNSGSGVQSTSHNLYYYDGGATFSGFYSNFNLSSLLNANGQLALGWCDFTIPSTIEIYYLNFDLKFMNGSTFHEAIQPPHVNYTYPFFINSDEDFSSGKFDNVIINSGNFFLDSSLSDFNFVIRKVITKNNGDIEYESQDIVFNTVLCTSSQFIDVRDFINGHIYKIPQSVIGINFQNGEEYIFSLEYDVNGEHKVEDHHITINISVEDEQLNSDQITQQKIDDTNKKLDETNDKLDKTNENLFNIFDVLNPFSEHFFFYQVLDMLGDFFKSLFVPSDDFLSNWFTEVSDYFEDSFGILYYPIDLVIQVLGRFDGISENDPVISFNDFSLFGVVLIPAYTYNFNDLLSNDTLKTIHNFYLITVDVIMWLGLLVYCKNVLTNIFGGKFTDDVIQELEDPGGAERSYARYSQHRQNVRRYKSEHGGS